MDVSGKTALVTGASKGIGYAIAMQLAERGAEVLVHARDEASSRSALAGLRRAVPAGAFFPVVADVSTLAGTHELAEKALHTADHLSLLVNNVGAMYNDLRYTSDGFEATFAINHLSVFLLTNLLLERLQASAPARIITIASEIHRKGHINFSDPALSTCYSANAALAQSKLANILFTRALAKRLGGTNVDACCIHPGHVRTDFTRDLKGWFGLFVKIISKRFLTPTEGAEPAVRLAIDIGGTDVNGGYFGHAGRIDPSDVAQDDAIAERLWNLSARMTGLTQSPSTDLTGKK